MRTVFFGYQYSPYLAPLAVAAAILGVLTALGAARLYRERTALNAGFTLTMAGAFWWAVSYAFQIAAPTLERKVFWDVLGIGPGMVEVGFFVFALAYAGHDRWLNWRVVGLAASQVVVYRLLVRPTYVFHDLAISSVALEYQGGIARLETDVAWWSVLDSTWGYLLVVVGILVVARKFVTARRVYRWQAGAVLAAALVPTAANLVIAVEQWGFAVWPYEFNPTPVAFAVTGVVLSLAVYRLQFLDLAPVARDRVVETMRDGYLVVDDDDRVVDHNRAAAELLGIDGDAVGAPAGRVLPDADVLDRHERGERVQEELVTADDRFVEVDVSALADDDEFVGRLVTLRDVTDRRSVEQRYQALIEHSSDLITVLDASGEVQYQSPSAARVLGYDPEEMVGRDVFEYVHEEDRDWAVEAFQATVFEEDAPDRVEFRVRTADGSVRTLEAVAANLLDNPFVEGVVVNSRDVTRRKEREEELQRKNERLDEFASVVSHDLRNPLSVAQGRAQLAEEDDPDAHLPKVRDALSRMEAIIEDVLALARQGQEVGDTETVDLAAVAGRAWGNVDTAETVLHTESSRDVTADPDRLLQLFENLYRNAVEHAGEDVTVRVGALPDGFYVEDDGPGIPEEDRETVFESGYTTATDGTGFGLAIVSRIVDAHDWSVAATESRDGGARFEVTGVPTPMATESVEARGTGD